MKCPECKAWTEVLESRPREKGSKYRRYRCANGHRFSTEERTVEAIETIRADDVQAGILRGALIERRTA
jgi:transcriptional regulator NrdR family protein